MDRAQLITQLKQEIKERFAALTEEEKNVIRKNKGTDHAQVLRKVFGTELLSDLKVKDADTKIVCTMMNDSYGFGSFRNKIWLKHSKDMAPEYQIGYHKIFLPLVKLSKTSKVLRKILEHIAVHRTIDIRQESRGKTHLLGRVYRKILEPICYLVGKYAK
jgi:hypothetical protein